MELYSAYFNMDNDDILKFYQENPHISFEEVNLQVLQLLKLANNQKYTEKNKNFLFSDQHQSPKEFFKQNMCHAPTNPLFKKEQTLEFTLNKLNPTAKIYRN